MFTQVTAWHQTGCEMPLINAIEVVIDAGWLESLQVDGMVVVVVVSHNPVGRGFEPHPDRSRLGGVIGV